MDRDLYVPCQTLFEYHAPDLPRGIYQENHQTHGVKVTVYSGSFHPGFTQTDGTQPFTVYQAENYILKELTLRNQTIALQNEHFSQIHDEMGRVYDDIRTGRLPALGLVDIPSSTITAIVKQANDDYVYKIMHTPLSNGKNPFDMVFDLELMQHFFVSEYLPSYDLVKFASTCKSYYEICDDILGLRVSSKFVSENSEEIKTFFALPTANRSAIIFNQIRSTLVRDDGMHRHLVKAMALGCFFWILHNRMACGDVRLYLPRAQGGWSDLSPQQIVNNMSKAGVDGGLCYEYLLLAYMRYGTKKNFPFFKHLGISRFDSVKVCHCKKDTISFVSLLDIVACDGKLDFMKWLSTIDEESASFFTRCPCNRNINQLRPLKIEWLRACICNTMKTYPLECLKFLHERYDIFANPIWLGPNEKWMNITPSWNRSFQIPELYLSACYFNRFDVLDWFNTLDCPFLANIPHEHRSVIIHYRIQQGAPQLLIWCLIKGIYKWTNDDWAKLEMIKSSREIENVTKTLEALTKIHETNQCPLPKSMYDVILNYFENVAPHHHHCSLDRFKTAYDNHIKIFEMEIEKKDSIFS